MKQFTQSRYILARVLPALLCALLTVYFYPHRETSRYKYEQGRPWNYSKLIAPFDIPVHPDSATLEKARDTLDTYFTPVFRRDDRVADSLAALLPKVPGTSLHSRVAAVMRRAYDNGVVEPDIRDHIDRGELTNVRILRANILSEERTARFITPRRLYMLIDSALSDPIGKRYLAEADIAAMLVPNVTYDSVESRRHYDREYLTLTADRGVIQQGQTIIDKGAVITAQDFTNLRTYESMLDERLQSAGKSDMMMVLGQLLYVCVLLGALLMFLRLYYPEIFANMRAVVFILTMITIFFLLTVLLDRFIPGGIYIVPYAIVPILILVFFDDRSALFATGVMTLICAGISSFPLEFIFLQFAAATTAAYSLTQLSQRSQLLRTSMLVAVGYIVAYTAMELMMNGNFEGFSWRMVAFLAVNSALTSMTYVLMFAVERVFGFTSVVTLVELADINSPLLRRLSDECPGTFQHSMAVSNLAADAAQRIGANTQLVRAGALYHDIGKMENPAFFTENQHGVNPHDALDPRKSAEIVISHVTDGLRLADKAGLPAGIKDFIRQHHGRGKAKYFYFTYCSKHPDEKVDPGAFTYPGPDPLSRETSLLMMADSVEAASRSLTEYTPEAITQLVNKIIDGQIADGLHNRSPLAFRDVRVIKEAFIKRLLTIYHSRLAYPEAAG